MEKVKRDIFKSKIKGLFDISHNGLLESKNYIKAKEFVQLQKNIPQQGNLRIEVRVCCDDEQIYQRPVRRTLEQTAPIQRKFYRFKSGYLQIIFTFSNIFSFFFDIWHFFAIYDFFGLIFFFFGHFC